MTPPRTPHRPRRRARLDVTVQSRARGIHRPAQVWLRARLIELAKAAGARHGELNVVIVNDTEMRRCHQRYMGLRSSTDVLTFDLRDRAGDPIEGDIIVCIDQARRQAQRRGHPLRLELLLYALHGLLHLRGYDDRHAADYRQMHQQEDELLVSIGLARAFETRNPNAEIRIKSE